MENIFNEILDDLKSKENAVERIRAVVEEIEADARQIATIMQNIHSEGGLVHVPSCCERSRHIFIKVKEGFLKLSLLVSPIEYYRFHDNWHHLVVHLSFLAALIIFLERNQLINEDEFTDFIGVKSDNKEGFHVDLEDFLAGLLQLGSELARLSVNCVTYGDYKTPVRISAFLNDLNSGFRLLNLKNDNLRKQFDALKYDVKKVEEVVYDLSIRNHLSAQVSEATSAAEFSTEEPLPK